MSALPNENRLQRGYSSLNFAHYHNILTGTALLLALIKQTAQKPQQTRAEGLASQTSRRKHNHHCTFKAILAHIQQSTASITSHSNTHFFFFLFAAYNRTKVLWGLMAQPLFGATQMYSNEYELKSQQSTRNMAQRQSARRQTRT